MNGRYQSILVVCTGNICRSPVGERLLRSRLPDMKVDSAGIAALTGEAADPVMAETSREHGLSLEGHCAKQLTPLMCREYDLILAMEQNHIEAVTRLAMESRGKTFLFGYWLQQMEIADPYRRGRDISGVIFQQLFSAAEEWVRVFQQVK
ncbi:MULTISPECIES: protein-tyrosine-phosphatase [Enterobacter]|uniref:arsenate reductase/protein-tyrosine-phosphatase family protein n=1 Tax=Enterobacter TaxID=547 RepID=UPI0004722E01|nr:MULTISPECIES: protein-tyrosine-phosphatase [Enterobacter]MCU6194250.1 protein tyrosine phosphatase [Enterobacter sichuanensis]MCU6428811.1 protein tyrosine phosphatase [Enterobacter sichuanensis]MCX4179856.1 protein tyrosine phosphatase [Enterobacter sp. HSTU-ASh6]MEB5959823.1 protein tyrosine phosphatase [Enterobacter sichuanensis]HDR2845722.1 protein tyrosine phosphatase [Enterobacter sichuanensis]